MKHAFTQPSLCPPPHYDHVLEARSAGLDDVVRTTVFVVSADPGDLRAVWEVMTVAGLATSSVGATLLGVTTLGYEGHLASC